MIACSGEEKMLNIKLKFFSLLLCSAAAATLSSTAAAADFKSKHAANGVSCTSCHGQKPDAAPQADKCRGCHSPDVIAKATEKFNFEAVLVDPKTKKEIRHTALINPHDSFHYARTENCLDCHREHQTSVNSCATCHDIEAWKMGAPR